jgi:hypothetical protein
LPFHGTDPFDQYNEIGLWKIYPHDLYTKVDQEEGEEMITGTGS